MVLMMMVLMVNMNGNELKPSLSLCVFVLGSVCMYVFQFVKRREANNDFGYIEG